MDPNITAKELTVQTTAVHMSLRPNALTVQMEAILLLGTKQELTISSDVRYHFASVIFFQLFKLVLQKTTYWNALGHSGDESNVTIMVQTQSA